MSKTKKLLLIDVDCGTDDAQAIMMAIAAPNVTILGITCVGGNTALDNVCKNVLRVLKVCGRSDRLRHLTRDRETAEETDLERELFTDEVSGSGISSLQLPRSCLQCKY
ncbi:hypothetical protein FKM82_006492 [Ascaphus truei]